MAKLSPAPVTLINNNLHPRYQLSNVIQESSIILAIYRKCTTRYCGGEAVHAYFFLLLSYISNFSSVVVLTHFLRAQLFALSGSCAAKVKVDQIGRTGNS